MTKEEYERLLKSDYWRGYSYSLIKERNFTCEDCGRQFLNERNKLQVHHLVYRDANPWSYKPEELIVLCEDCHKKRHGIWEEPEKKTETEQLNQNLAGNARSGENKFNNRSYYPIEPRRRFKYGRIVVVLLLLLIFLSQIVKKVKHSSSENNAANIETAESSIEDNTNAIRRKDATFNSSKRSVSHEKTESKSQDVTKVDAEGTNLPIVEEQETPVEGPQTKISSSPSSSSNLDRSVHSNVVKQAQQVGVSTEGSTSDILERITHANVVKQAQRVGVSTEGSTSDILERITHANVVKQAQRAGVSTEGSTSDILERITHANVVKQAQRAGVSTEGSTSEILDRITHANVVKQAQRAGVSTDDYPSNLSKRGSRKERKYNY